MTKKTLEKLTPEQEARLPEFRDKWIDIGLSCEPCDFERAKAGAVKAYKAAGLEPPKLYFLFDSPISAALGVVMLKQNMDNAFEKAKALDLSGMEYSFKVAPPLEKFDKFEFNDNLVQNIATQIAQQVLEHVHVGLEVGESSIEQIRAVVLDGFDHSNDTLLSEIKENMKNQVWGSHDAEWLAFYDYFKVVCDITECSQLDGLSEIAGSCGWWAPYEGVCIFQHRHQEVHLDESKQIHNEDGPSISYRDGFSVYAINGHRIPGWIIEKPEEITIKKIRDEENVETKRIMRERFGESEYLREIGAKVIDTDSVSTHNQDDDAEPILRALMEDDEGRRFLVTTDGSTSRTYPMEVPSELSTCGAAHRFLGGIEESKIIAQS